MTYNPAAMVGAQPYKTPANKIRKARIKKIKLNIQPTEQGRTHKKVPSSSATGLDFARKTGQAAKVRTLFKAKANRKQTLRGAGGISGARRKQAR